MCVFKNLFSLSACVVGLFSGENKKSKEFFFQKRRHFFQLKYVLWRSNENKVFLSYLEIDWPTIQITYHVSHIRDVSWPAQEKEKTEKNSFDFWVSERVSERRSKFVAAAASSWKCWIERKKRRKTKERRKKKKVAYLLSHSKKRNNPS